MIPQNTILLGFVPKDSEQHNEQNIAQAAQMLRQGEVVAFPTETVYGLGARVFNAEAVQRVYAAKGRPADNPLIVHCAVRHDAEQVAEFLPAWFDEVYSRFMPGPLTVLLPKHRSVPDVVSAGLNTVAVRFPAHPLAQQLIRAVGEPLVAPSANRSGYPSPTTADHVLHDLKGRIAAVLDGGVCEVGIESTVVNMLHNPPVILRPGHIHKEELDECAAALGMEPFVYAEQFAEQFAEQHMQQAHTPLSPGMKYRHYAPEAFVVLVNSAEEALSLLSSSSQPPTRVFAHPDSIQLQQTMSNDAVGSDAVLPLTEHNLYAELRRADTDGITRIVVIGDAHLRKHTGLMNRLEKAASRV